jgi:hypothetical protein
MNLLERRVNHEASKLEPPEKAAFDLAVTYGSEEYMNSFAGLNTALDRHYANDSHHPQHYPNGISGMLLFDLVGFLEIGRARFALSGQPLEILTNTAKGLGWMP